MRGQSTRDMIFDYWAIFLVIATIIAVAVVLVAFNSKPTNNYGPGCYISTQIRCVSTNMTYMNEPGYFVFRLNFTNTLGQQIMTGNNSMKVTFGTHIYYGTCMPYLVQDGANATCTANVLRTGIRSGSYVQDTLSLMYSICSGSECSGNYITIGRSYQYAG